MEELTQLIRLKKRRYNQGEDRINIIRNIDTYEKINIYCEFYCVNIYNKVLSWCKGEKLTNDEWCYIIEKEPNIYIYKCDAEHSFSMMNSLNSFFNLSQKRLLYHKFSNIITSKVKPQIIHIRSLKQMNIIVGNHTYETPLVESYFQNDGEHEYIEFIVRLQTISSYLLHLWLLTTTRKENPLHGYQLIQSQGIGKFPKELIELIGEYIDGVYNCDDVLNYISYFKL